MNQAFNPEQSNEKVRFTLRRTTRCGERKRNACHIPCETLLSLRLTSESGQRVQARPQR